MPHLEGLKDLFEKQRLEVGALIGLDYARKVKCGKQSS